MTKKDLAYRLNINVNLIEQVNKQQLFIVTTTGDYDRTLYSYWTKVGVRSGNVWQITGNKYSVTTTRQLNKFKRTMIEKGYGVVQLAEHWEG